MNRLRLFVAAIAFLSIIGVIGLLSQGAQSSLGETGTRLVQNDTSKENSFKYPGANIILIGIDTLRPDHTSVFGYSRNTSPNLAAFAQQSFVFKRCFAAAPWTLPSWMALMSGLYPTMHGLVNKYLSPNEEGHLLPGVETLPQVLKKDGYAVLGAFTGDAGVHSKYGYGKGFDVYVDDLKFGALDYSGPKAMDWLKTSAQGKRFFLFVHGYDVHGQYDPPKGYTRKFDPDYHGKLKGNKAEQEKLREAGLETATKEGSIGEPRLFDMNDDDAKFYAALYDEKIVIADERVGQLLSQLKELGLWDSSIVIIASDHGDEFMEHGMIDHGHSLYDELTHVMLMIHFPHQTAGREVNDLVSNMDALVTAMDSTGVPVGHPVNGQSLLPILRGDKPGRTEVFSETDYRFFVHKRCVRTDQYKWIFNLTTQKRELYDLKADPGEHNNIQDSNKNEAYKLEQDVFKWLGEMNTSVDKFKDKKEDFHPEF